MPNYCYENWNWDNWKSKSYDKQVLKTSYTVLAIDCVM
jgi:hypothetical protein